MSDDTDGSKSISGLQDPRVERFRPRPDELPQPRISLSGLLGDSDRPGHRRLYFTTALDYYVEFKIDDAVATVSIPAERAPFPDVEAIEVTLEKDAVLTYSRTRLARKPDEFDIDLRRMHGRRRRIPDHRDAATVEGGTCGEDCGSELGTCQANTCYGETCATCDQDTCAGQSCVATLCDSCAATCMGTCAASCQCTLEDECHSNFTNCASCMDPYACQTYLPCPG